MSRKPQTLGCFFFSLKRQLWTPRRLVLIPAPTQPQTHADHSGAGEGMGPVSVGQTLVGGATPQHPVAGSKDYKRRVVTAWEARLSVPSAKPPAGR